MEWKADEKLMYDLATDALKQGVLPIIGMPSGGGLPNAGFSVWPFAFFRLITNSPVIMMLLVAISNVLALFIFMACVKKLELKNKQNFYFGLLSFGVSLMPVLFSRKLWAQDLIPIFIASMWYLFLIRKHWWALILMGVVGALVGQLHLSGFYYFAGLMLAAILYKKVKFKQLLITGIGFVLGMLPAIEWMRSLFEIKDSVAGLHHFLKFEFWMHAILDPLGINAQYSFGSNLIEFVKFNINNNIGATFLPAVVAMVIVSIFITSLIQTIAKKRELISENKELKFILTAFILIPGVLLTVSCIPVRSHYLIGALPFLGIVFVQLISSLGEKWVKTFIAFQAIFTLLFLSYVHIKQDVGGDYGKVYELSNSR